MSFPTDPSPPSPLASRPAWLACTAAMLLSGCTLLRPSTPAPVAAAPAVAASAPATAPAAAISASESDLAARRLLAFHERVRELSPAEQAREAQRLGDPPEPGGRLELALLLAHTRQNGDLARALALVEPLARPAATGPWQGLARLLQSRLSEQRRHEEQIDRLARQLREQQGRLDQLSSQIDALRAIERSLSTRPALPAAPAPAPTAAVPAAPAAPSPGR